MFKGVEKVEGKIEDFQPKKITNSVFMAAQNVGGTDKELALVLGNQVISVLGNKYNNDSVIGTFEIGNLVEKILIENGHARTAKAFILYRENKKHIHQDIESLGIKDDIGLPYNTLYILKQRYLKRTEKGEIVETPMGMIDRVAEFLSLVEKGKKKQQIWYEKFKGIMTTLDFLPGSRTLANAGKNSPQLANCFVWPIDDDMDSIFGVLHMSTLIKKNGGGCGYNFSNIRPEGDTVNGIPDLAAGPVKMIEMFDLMTSLFRQEGKYESGNMAILNVDHPDIFNFLSAKKDDGYLSKTNISVGVTNKFMKAATEGKDWKLVNPRTGRVVNTVNAKSILDLMAAMAWQTGDPGIVNLSAINKGTALANPLFRKRGPIVATNPCGEVPLYYYESCNLGYLNFVNFIKNGEFDYERLAKVIRIAVRLMDNVISASWFPVDEVGRSVREHRRIGIGAVGWAETLVRMEIPYDSPSALRFARKLVKTMYENAFDESCNLAEEKGPFPLVKDSIWSRKKRKPRNVSLLTFPPSSSNAVICNTSFGIEPYFALAYEQNVMEGMRLKTVVPVFVEKLKERGLYSDEVIKKLIENHGSAQGIKEIPQDIQDVFKTAHDITWRDHIKMQAAFQTYTDNAITKTINMPSETTPDEIKEAFILSWQLGCKGITIYRDRAKANQVFEFGGSQNYQEKKIICPNCDITLSKEGKCYKCVRCGFSTCEL